MEQLSLIDLQKTIRLAQYIIADKYLVSLYPQIQMDLDDKAVFYVESPEKSKSMQVYEEAIDFFIEKGITRRDDFLVIGGGATSDLGGFVASTILRGVAWNVIPTTLLAMVDAAIGGKVGINSKAGKNLIGNFHAPKRIFLSYEFLNTLSESEKISGLGEVVKYAFLNKEVFNMLEMGAKLSDVIWACAHFKTHIVQADFKESGQRKFLNLGHSFGHAFEKSLCITHGEAVLMGLKLILALYSPHLLSSLDKMISAQNISLVSQKCDFEMFSDFFKRDKKVIQNNIIELVIPKEIGEVELRERRIDDVLKEVKSHELFETYFH